MELFRSPAEEVLEQLRDLDLDRTTPLQALGLLAELKGKVNDTQ